MVHLVQAIAHGTDIWYAMTPELNVTDFTAPARLTDNFTQMKDPNTEMQILCMSIIVRQP